MILIAIKNNKAAAKIKFANTAAIMTSRRENLVAMYMLGAFTIRDPYVDNLDSSFMVEPNYRRLAQLGFDILVTEGIPRLVRTTGIRFGSFVLYRKKYVQLGVFEHLDPKELQFGEGISPHATH